jgi:hypothetical protein
MKVKMFLQAAGIPIETFEADVNRFLAPLASSAIKYVNTAATQAETIITIWYDEPKGAQSAELSTDEELGEVIEFSTGNPFSERTA